MRNSACRKCVRELSEASSCVVRMRFIQLCNTAVSCWSARLLRLSSFAEAAAALAHDSTVAVRLRIAPLVVALKYVIPQGACCTARLLTRTLPCSHTVSLARCLACMLSCLHAVSPACCLACTLSRLYPLGQHLARSITQWLHNSLIHLVPVYLTIVQGRTRS